MDLSLPITLTIVFDNYSLQEETITSWGFSCVVQTADSYLLFDTGNDGKLLLNNIKEMGLDPLDFEHVFLSHMHWDHVGGLVEFLRIKPDAKIYMVNSAMQEDVKHIAHLDNNIQLVDGPVELFPGFHSLGDMPGYLNEQSMVLQTGAGLVIVVGCAHPGIVHIVEQAQQLFPNEPVEMVIGGLHLNQATEQEILDIIKDLQNLQVHKIAPSHCTGETAIAMMQQAWGDSFIKAGVGLTLTFS